MLHTNNEITTIVKNAILDKNIKEVFFPSDQKRPLSLYSAEYRTILLEQYLSTGKDKVILDSEHGINGCLIEGSVKIWNKEEFGPWIIDKTTVVLGSLNIEGTLIIISPAASLFVINSIEAENIVIRNDGEIHCGGKINVKNYLLTDSSSYIRASEMSCKKVGLYGKGVSSKIFYETTFESEIEGFKYISGLR